MFANFKNQNKRTIPLINNVLDEINEEPEKLKKKLREDENKQITLRD